MHHAYKKGHCSILMVKKSRNSEQLMITIILSLKNSIVLKKCVFQVLEKDAISPKPREDQDVQPGCAKILSNCAENAKNWFKYYHYNILYGNKAYWIFETTKQILIYIV